MPADYSGQNLRGRSFKGQNLEGANFIGADIRSADFSGAKLHSANFSDAKAGLQRRWAIFLVLVSWVLMGLSGYLSAFAGGLVVLLILDTSKDVQIAYHSAGWTTLIILIIFFFVTIGQGIQAGLGAVAVAVAVAFAVAVAIAGAFAVAITGAVAFAVAVTFAVAFAVAVAIAGAVAVAVAGAFAGAFAVTIAGAFAIAGAVAVAIAFAIAFAKVGAIAFAGAFAGAGTLVLFSTYVSWRALRGDPKHALIRNSAIAFAAFKGTSFRSADLTDANFTKATLKSTDFRNANLTRTCFHKTKKLDHVRPGSSYLKKSKLCRLLITGNGQGENFENQILQGINFSKVNLANANLINTNFYQSSLKEANLEGALLVRAQFESADLTEVKLTGACIEEWVVTKTTILDKIQCKYIFMKLTENNDKRDLMPLKGEFQNDDFILFVQSIIDTIKLYHERDVNPSLALHVLQSLSEDYQCTLEIVKIEKRGESGAIIEVKIPGNLNEEQLKETYYEKYKKNLKLYMTDPNKELQSPTNIENVTVHKGSFISGNVSNSSVNIHNREDTIMSEASKYNLNNPKFGGGFSGDEGTTIGGTLNDYSSNIDYSSKQNLAEAASEIQQLLSLLQNQGLTTEQAQQQVAQDLANKADNDPTVLGKLVKWLQSLGNTAANTTVTEAAKEVFKIALRLSGIQIL